MKKISIKASIGDTVYCGGIECEVVELSIRKERTNYMLRNKKESPFGNDSTGWFFEGEFHTTNKPKVIGFKVCKK